MFGLTPYRRNNPVVRGNDFFDVRSMFEDFFSNPFMQFEAFNSAGAMKVDVRETDKEYVVEAEIPGVNKEDIKLELRDDTLTISVVRNEEINEERKDYIHRERRYGSFSRSLYFENVKNEDATARYNDGVLTVTLPKSPDAKRRGHNIDIR